MQELALAEENPAFHCLYHYSTEDMEQDLLFRYFYQYSTEDMEQNLLFYSFYHYSMEYLKKLLLRHVYYFSMDIGLVVGSLEAVGQARFREHNMRALDLPRL